MNLSRYFDQRERPDLLAAAQHLDDVATHDGVQRAAAAPLERRRRDTLAGRGIDVTMDWKCPCFLRDPSGRTHRQRQGDRHQYQVCYTLWEHPRGWRQEGRLIAVSCEPYDGVSGEAISRFSAELKQDDLKVEVCACCATHFPGMGTSIIILRSEDRHTHVY